MDDDFIVELENSIDFYWGVENTSSKVTRWRSPLLMLLDLREVFEVGTFAFQL